MLKKIFLATITIFILITIITITNLNKNNVLRTNYEIEKITNIKNNTVYLLDNNNYFVKVDIFINNGNEKDTVRKIIDYLKISNEEIESNFKGYIPSNTKINDIQIIDNILYLDFSKELVSKNKDIVLKGLIKSLLELKDIEKVSIKVEGEYQKGYEGEINNIIINNENTFNNRKNINKVVIYYYENINDNNYLVPVTKYLNDDREKIDIIIEELRENIPTNLISYLNINTKLINSKEENNSLILEFNNYILEEENNYNQISQSVFANYDVSAVIFNVNGKIKKIVSKNT